MAGVGETESLAERQEFELESLKAIYLDDVQDLREKDAWKVPRPPELQITLKPQESMTGTDVHATVELHVKYPTNYPEIVPDMKLLNAKGLSNYLVSELQKGIDDKAKELVGEVMLYDICQEIQSFLHQHNKPPSKSFYEEMISNKKKHEEIDQQKQLELKKRKEQKQLEQIEEEIQKRKDDAKRRRQEAKQLERLSLSEASSNTMSGFNSPLTPIAQGDGGEQGKRTHLSASNTPSPVRESPTTPTRLDRRRSPLIAEAPALHSSVGRTSTPLRQRSVSAEEGMACDRHRGTAVVTFTTKNKERTIQRGHCLGHSSRRKGSTVYVGMDKDTGELVAVAEWLVQWRQAARKLNTELRREDEKQAADFMKQIATYECELNSLLRLHHPHLVHYYAMNSKQEVGRITVSVLLEYIGGGDLQHYVQEDGQQLSLDVLRAYTIQLLDALAFLHSKGVVHRDLRPSSLMIDNGGKLRLADYSLVKRLSELVSSAGGGPDTGNEKEVLPLTLGRGSKKCDIYQLGLTLLSLAQGKQVRGLVPDIPKWLPPVLSDFLSVCLLSDERQRWSVNQLQQHSFLTIPLPASPQQRPQPQQQQQADKEGKAGEEEPRKRLDVEDDDDDDDDRGLIPYIPCSGSGSRLQNEFEILKFIGKGGFGDVIKVRNKLDGRLYAIKRIPLNPRSSVFKKKITREVKMLSRLSHENVVRYYNSWIETSQEVAPSDTSTFTESVSQRSTPSVNLLSAAASVAAPAHYHRDNSSSSGGFGLVLNNMEVPSSFQAGDTSVEWSVSLDKDAEEEEEEDSSSSDDEEEEDVFGGASFMPFSDSDDDGIIFEQDEEKVDEWESKIEEESQQIDLSKVDTASETALPKLQFLYIQMEFCEKSTLRHCIDDSLYTDMERVWRLFREIIEGLLHIHEQGMIHRDLKPVNIFLDSNDHVKIGDFGLATTDIISKQQSGLLDMSLAPSGLNLSAAAAVTAADSVDEAHGSSLTGKVGTALYVSPEIMATHTRTHYNQKVDIYSLGVIFFEMCYKPLLTGMERVTILTNLRKPTIELPEDFDEFNMPNQAAIIRLLLIHDPAKRPTSQELLKSDYLPPPQREEAELNEVLRSTIANPESKSYKHMIKAIYDQQVREAVDFAYDTEMMKSGGLSAWHAMIERNVYDSIETIFRHHGALRINTPLLMPRSSLYTAAAADACVCFMDRSGGLVSLPCDLRVPFARWIARSGVSGPLKRYSMQPVYLQRACYNSHPRELRACSFDVMSGSAEATLLLDAECIHVVHEIVSEFHGLQSRSYYLRVNHSDLLRGVLTYCGVPEDLHAEVCTVLGDTKIEKRKKLQLQTKLCSLSLSEYTVAKLYKFLEMEGTFKEISCALISITKTQGVAGHLTKKGLHEIEGILGHMDSLGAPLKCVLALGLLTDPPAAATQHFSGLIFQVVADVRRKKKLQADVLAAGGRYDALVSHFRRPGSPALQQRVVGVTVSLDKIITAELEAIRSDAGARPQELACCAVDVLVCSLSHRTMEREKLALVSELWAAGISADIMHDVSVEDVSKQDMTVSCQVILKDGDNMLRVRSLQEGKIVERKIPPAELIDFLLNSNSKQEISENSSNQPSSASLPPITFIIPDDSKMAKNLKRTYEMQIYSSVTKTLANVSTKAQLEILGLELTGVVLKTIVANLELSSENAFNSSIKGVIEKHQRLRKYLSKIFDHIFEMKFDKKSFSVFVLYSTKEDSFKLLL